VSCQFFLRHHLEVTSVLIGPRRIQLTIAALALGVLAPAAGGATSAQADPSDPRPPEAGVAGTVAAVGETVFSVLPGFRQSTGRRTTIEPTEYVAARVDLTAARAALAPAAPTARRATPAAPVTVALPAPDGSTALFSVVEDSVLAPRLQAAHPELRTYAGTGITDPTDTVRLSLTPLGLHASVRSLATNRSWYVDPAYLGRGVTTHLSYLRSAIPDSARLFVEQEPLLPPGAEKAGGDQRRQRVEEARRAGEVVTRRTYELAFVTEQSYAAYFGTENVLATKVVQVNRANQIYLDDMAIAFVLAEGSDRLNLDTDAKAIGADGPCGASPCFTTAETSSCGGDVLDRNKFVAGQIVGADRFDLGHFGSGDGGGGVAYLGVVGGPDKAGGCTALDPPAGDFYAVDFFAHEVGHQMAGNHTFDGANGSCAGLNRSAPTSVEPGSGSSVMAYAGICGNDDLQPHTDPYFSQRTIDEFTAEVTTPPTNIAEQQSVNLAGFDAGDTFQLTYPGATPVVVTRGGNYTAAGLQAAIQALTGTAATVTGYDGADAVGPEGFTVDFAGTGDLQRLGVGATTGGTTGFVGVIQNGGPTTEGGTPTVTSNRRPVAVAPADRTIPVSTPFALTGSATDADAGQRAGLTYLWEQNDEGIPGDPILGIGSGTPLSSPLKVLGPLFRVFGTKADVSAEDTLLYESPGQNLATTDSTRSFPDVDQILAETTNAEAPCPAPASATAPMDGAALDCYSEFLPDAVYAATARELNFRLTVRDGSVLGGGTGSDDVTLTLDPLAGPFLVTSRGADGTSATAGAVETVEWDVAGTSGAALAPNVRISLSLDGGQTFRYVLAASTPNDGSQDVTLPGFNAERARIKVEAVDNYFFDINNADFAITGGVAEPEPEEPEEPETGAPSTTITGGQPRGSFVVGRRAGYTYRSSQQGSTFACTLDRRPVDCAGTRTVLRKLKPGTHLFTVAARNAAGVVDPTPARARFAVVLNERVLERETRGWRTVKDRRAYKNTFATTSQRRRVLSVEVERATRLSLLVARARGFGRLAVSLDGERLRVLPTQARRPKIRALRRVVTFARPTSGTVTITSLDQRPVVVDGIGVFTPRRLG
jgi:hypothetical protein